MNSLYMHTLGNEQKTKNKNIHTTTRILHNTRSMNYATNVLDELIYFLHHAKKKGLETITSNDVWDRLKLCIRTRIDLVANEL